MDRINVGVNRMMGTDAAASILARLGAEPLAMTTGEFERHVDTELGRWRRLAQRHRIGAD